MDDGIDESYCFSTNEQKLYEHFDNSRKDNKFKMRMY